MSRPFRIGIRGRMFLAFSVLVGMTIIASAVGWLLLTSLGDNFETIVSKNIPAVTVSSQMAEVGAAIIGTAPILAAVPDERERQRTWAVLMANLMRMNDLFEGSGKTGLDPLLKKQTTALLGPLTVNLRDLDENVRRGLWYRTEKERLEEKLRWALTDFLDEMEPMIDDIHFNIELLRKPGRVAEHQSRKELAIELARERALFRINAGGSLLAGLISGAANLPDEDSLRGAELYAGEVEAGLREDLEVIKDIPGALAIVQSLDDIFRFAAGSESLFQMRKDEFQVTGERKLLLQKNLSLVSELQKLITESVQRENRAAQDAVVRSRDGISSGKKYLLVATSGSLFAAILIAWIYVGRNMLNRITALDESMREIAEGNLKSEIQVKGDDEICAMALSLKTLRDTLLQTQNDLVQAGKLALLGQLSAGIAHEINQPLSAMRHFSRNARVFLNQERIEEARLNLEKIENLSERVRIIIDRLRSMARKPGEGLVIVDLLHTVHNVLALLEHRIQKSGVEVKIKINDENRYAAAGQVRLEQVLLNLLNNGFDAMQDSEIKQLDISSSAFKERVELQVRDTGSGITESNLERIFDPFFTTKEVGQGVGIGLSISYNIIKDFGGDIRCESTPGKGTVFRILLDPGLKRKE